MSFILDALKKSENERQRQAGPALFELKVAPPRSRFPVWVVVLAALLAVNAVVVAAWLLLRSLSTAPAAATAPAAPVEASQNAAPVAAQGRPAAAGGATAAPPLPAAAPAAPAAAPAASAAAPPAGTGRQSAPRDPQLAALDSPADGEINAEDYEPAIDPRVAGREAGAIAAGGAGAATSAATAHVRTEATGLPTRDELHSPAIAGLPELRLDLLVYDPSPGKRFVMINMHRLHEGDSVQDGLRVVRITEEGAELDYRGTRFLLPHE